MDETLIFYIYSCCFPYFRFARARVKAVCENLCQSVAQFSRFFRATHGLAAFGLAFSGSNEVARHSSAFAASNLNLPLCRGR